VCALIVLALPVAGLAQNAAPAAPDPVTGLLLNVERAMNAADRTAFTSYFSVPPTLVQGYIADLFIPGAVRSVIRERDRAPLEAVPAGEGYRVVVEFFVETPGRARLRVACRVALASGTDACVLNARFVAIVAP